MQGIRNTEEKGDAREESYYSTLETLLEDIAEDEGQPDADVTVLPKQTEAGNPDFRMWSGPREVTGYIEAKRPGTDLGRVEETDQLQRYREAFPNVILTDFYEFRLYRDGERVARAGIRSDGDGFTRLMKQFFAFSQPPVFTAKDLAVVLAKRTRFLEHIILRELESEEGKTNRLQGFYEAFSRSLITGLTEEQFADLYAQTVTYGLFAARSRADSAESFNRRNAAEYIPSTIGILRDAFEYISLGRAPKEVEVVVDDIAGVLSSADIEGIMETFFDEGKGKDPILHFYETFLAVYDPDLRERRGVYYTPESVVRYIVRSVDYVLRTVFQRDEGLAEQDVTVLDPAAGTLTFIAEAFRQAVSTFTETYGTGGRERFVTEHLMENYYAFELMMAPYAIGHLKIGYILEELGHSLTDEERFPLYLTNTLEMEEIEQTNLPGMDSLSKESRKAGAIKKEQPVLAVMGNPPYSGHSANDGEWIDSLLKEGYSLESGAQDDGYYRVDGKPLEEQQKKWLQDDYAKFIRFAQWKIDQHGKGVVAFITNHSFLDNPTFRGMRESLMGTFDQIYTLDLHGNSLKKETAPDGSTDENVFDIQQGVAITLMIKKDELEQKVCRGDLYGTRDEKYTWLDGQRVDKTDWTEITPQSPFYFFTKRNYDLEEEYNRFLPVSDVFPLSNAGIVTSRNDFVIDFDKESLRKRIEVFRDDSLTDEEVEEELPVKGTNTWSLSKNRQKIQQDTEWEEKFCKVLFRPFDVRHIFYHSNAIQRPGKRVAKHMLAGSNIGLVTSNQAKRGFRHALISDTIVSFNSTGSAGSFGSGYLFPLYRYPQAEERDLFSQKRRNEGRVANIDENVWDGLTASYGERPSPEEVMYYVYAVLYAPTYRSTYAEFLKTAPPKIPFTDDYDLFQRLAALGKQIADLHLMKAGVLDKPNVKFHGTGSNVVAKPKRVGRDYRPEEERVYINEDEQYFGPIVPEVWDYEIGSYQVLDKWLYERREKELTLEEIQHFCRVATTLEETILLQEEVDEVYPGVEKDLFSQ